MLNIEEAAQTIPVSSLLSQRVLKQEIKALGNLYLISEMSVLKEWVRSGEREGVSQVKRAGKMFPAHGPL